MRKWRSERHFRWNIHTFYFFKSQQFTQKDRTKLEKYLDICAEERYHVYLFAQKTFIAGLTSGSVKG